MTALQITMISLGSSLADLRAAVIAETTRAQTASNAAAIAQAQAQLSSAYAIQQDALSAGQSLVNAVRSLEASTGGQLRKGQGAGILGIIDGALAYDSPNWSGPRSAESAWNSQFWSDGGLEDQIFAARGQINSANDALEAARAAVRAMGAVPAFASGGYHSGGLRLVGEDGPELEATGQSRIYSASQTRDMLAGRDDGALVAELRALRHEVAAGRAENTQLLLKIESYERQMARTLRDWDINGQPAERTT